MTKAKTTVRERVRAAADANRKAGLEYANADSENEFAAAEKRILKSAWAYGMARLGQRTAERMAAAKARGIHVGRPAKLTTKKALELVKQAGSIKKAATLSGVSRRSIARALRRPKKG